MTRATMPYSDIPGVNWSSLKHMSVSPRMYRHRLANPEPRKPAFVIGGAIHCAVLEPDQFDQRYAVFDGTRRGDAWIEWQAEHPGMISMKSGEMDRVMLAGQAVREHRVARDLLRGGRAEEVLTWTDERTGIACKGRLDYIRPDLVIDLKSSRDPAPERFARDAAKYGYAAQMMFYHDGARAARRVTGDRRPCVIVVRTKDDFDVGVYELDHDAIETGRAIYRSLLDKLNVCTTADYFHGVAPELRALSLPPMANDWIVSTESEEL